MNQVKKKEPHISDLGYGGFEAGHLWAEPKTNQTSSFYLDANFEKAFKIDDISSVFHYELINDIGVLGSFVPGEENYLLRFENFDGALNEDEIANLPTVSLTEASEDFVLDVDFSKKVPELDYQFCEELSLRKTSIEVNSPETSNEGNGTSKSFIPPPKCFNNQSGKSCGKLENESSCLCDLQNSNKGNDSLDSACSLLVSTEASCNSKCIRDDRLFQSEDLSDDSSSEENIALVRHRRLCKPPKRYMEGSFWFQSKLHKVKKSPRSTMKGEDLGVLSQRKHQRKRKVPKALKNYSLWDLGSDDEDGPSSKFWGIKARKKGRGKKAKVWTVDEVVMLVDGLARFGVGQWTAVQRACFNSSRRSAIDIRDKWRNLVKSNCKSLNRKHKDDQKQRNCTRPLPTSVIERVRELATSQPVQRNQS